MDLIFEFGKFYLVCVNFLLGEIIGLVISEDDLLDIIIYVVLKDFFLFLDEYFVCIEFMRMVLFLWIFMDDSDNFIVGFIERFVWCLWIIFKFVIMCM